MFERNKKWGEMDHILIIIFVVIVLVVLGAIIFGMKLRRLYNEWQNQEILQRRRFTIFSEI